MKRKNYLPFILAGAAAIAVALSLALVLLFKGGGEPEEPPDDNYNRTHVFPDEVRGVYVPTVYNLAFPSRADLSADELKSEIDALVARTNELGLNSIYFQVRSACDALYKSDIFPVAPCLSSNGELTLDCLGYLVKTAHESGISVTAWVNPLRVTYTNTTVDELDDKSPAKGEYRDYVVTYGGKLYFDPARPEVRQLVARGVAEIVENYEVDGIIFDDYFYPYKVYETNPDGSSVLAVFNDNDSYETYAADGQSLGDFRRENINLLIKEVYNAVHGADKKCRFGVAPFGIWQNDSGKNGGSATSGLESYNDLYCDTLAWIEGGYIDYVAPQIYWDGETKSANFDVIASWWNEKVKDYDVSLYFSHAAYRYDGDDFAAGEMTRQLKYTSSFENCGGNILYSFAAFRDDLKGICTEISEYYKK